MTKESHSLHEGELRVQKRRQTPRELSDAVPSYIYRDMPQQHAEFFSRLSYMPLGTIDGLGRPWVSLLITQSDQDTSVGIEVFRDNRTDITAETNPFDPFVKALKQTGNNFAKNPPLIAGVGIDFTNRRRNKIAGKVTAFSTNSRGKLNLSLVSDQHLGN